MARRSSYRKTRTSRARSSYRGRRSPGRRYTASRRGVSARGSRSRGNVIKLVIQQAPEVNPGAVPGVPGTVGVAALGPAKRSSF